LSFKPHLVIEEQYYPAIFQWHEPAHIQVGELKTLYRFWMNRQNLGLDPLHFVGYKSETSDNQAIKQTKHSEDDEDSEDDQRNQGERGVIEGANAKPLDDEDEAEIQHSQGKQKLVRQKWQTLIFNTDYKLILERGRAPQVARGGGSGRNNDAASFALQRLGLRGVFGKGCFSRKSKFLYIYIMRFYLYLA
jgi:hypothetical protein